MCRFPYIRYCIKSQGWPVLANPIHVLDRGIVLFPPMCRASWLVLKILRACTGRSFRYSDGKNTLKNTSFTSKFLNGIIKLGVSEKLGFLKIVSAQANGLREKNLKLLSEEKEDTDRLF